MQEARDQDQDPPAGVGTRKPCTESLLARLIFWCPLKEERPREGDVLGRGTQEQRPEHIPGVLSSTLSGGNCCGFPLSGSCLPSTPGQLHEESISCSRDCGVDFRGSCTSLGDGPGFPHLLRPRQGGGWLGCQAGGGRGSQRTFPVLADCAGLINVARELGDPREGHQGLAGCPMV